MTNFVLNAAKTNEILSSIVDMCKTQNDKLQKLMLTTRRQNRIILKHRKYLNEHFLILKEYNLLNSKEDKEIQMDVNSNELNHNADEQQFQGIYPENLVHSDHSQKVDYLPSAISDHGLYQIQQHEQKYMVPYYINQQNIPPRIKNINILDYFKNQEGIFIDDKCQTINYKEQINSKEFIHKILHSKKYSCKKNNLINTNNFNTILSSEDQGDLLNEKECVICLTEKKDTMLLPCNHLVLCNQCANDIKVNKHNCPVCRGSVIDVIKNL